MAEYNLHGVAFPRLNESQIAALGRCAGATARRFQDGQTLFRVGDRDIRFFVVKSGAVEILDQSGEAPRIVTVHEPVGSPGTELEFAL